MDAKSALPAAALPAARAGTASALRPLLLGGVAVAAIALFPLAVGNP